LHTVPLASTFVDVRLLLALSLVACKQRNRIASLGPSAFADFCYFDRLYHNLMHGAAGGGMSMLSPPSFRCY